MSDPKTPKLWCRMDQVHKKALNHVRLRQNGTITSIKTPWPKVNKVTANGFEWNTIVTMAGRPGSGKTTILNEFTRKAFDLNPTENFCVLDLQFEMTQEVTGIREFSSITGLAYRELVSAETPLDDLTMKKLTDFVNRQQSRDIYQVDVPLTVDGIKKTVEEFIKEHPGKKVIVTLDHSILIKMSGMEQSKFDTLYNLGEALTEMKKRLPVMFIVLTQMNRSIEEDARKKPGNAANFPNTSDIFGSDALLQHSDIVIVISVPASVGLSLYGAEKFMVNEHTLVLHFLKMRNGQTSMLFFEKQFNKQRIVETKIPDHDPQGSVALSSRSAAPTPHQFLNNK